MKKSICIVALTLALSNIPGFAKTINLPPTDIVDVIRRAREYLATRQIDVSHRFLSAIEWKNIHEELPRPYWLLTWTIAAGTSEGQLHLRVFNNGEIDMECTNRALCPPGSNQSFSIPLDWRQDYPPSTPRSQSKSSKSPRSQ